MNDTGDKLLEIKQLKRYFDVKRGFLGVSGQKVKAVDGVSLSIGKGETFGLVGESGCGKTTLGRTILRLYEPTDGQILYDGFDITNINMKPLRKKMQMIFQDPYASLNPRMTVADIVKEPMDIHKTGNKAENYERVLDLLEMVGLNKEHANRYPHEFSGGQRQRIGIARSLAVEPQFIVCDEPISALDVSIQAQIINMLEDLKVSLGLTYLFITHDISMVKHISDRIGVMYLGRIVETTESDELYYNAAHPYTRALLSAIPISDPRESRRRQRIILEGDVPSPINPPLGCRFSSRCMHVMKKCVEQEPELKKISPDHLCACHLY